MRISDWSSDVCSSDLSEQRLGAGILELEADIALAQRRAQHYGKAAELQDAVVGGNETGPVGAGERDTAARPVAFRDKAASNAVGHASERGEAVAARGVHQPLPVRFPGPGGGPKGGERKRGGSGKS